MNNSLIDGIRNLRLRIPSLTRIPNRIIFRFVLPCLAGATIGLLMIVSPWLALAFTLFVALCVVVLIKPVFLCYLTIMAIALTSGMERGKPIPLLRTNEAVLVLSAAFAFLILLSRKNRYSIKFEGLEIAIFILIAGTTIIPGAHYLIRGTNLTFQDGIVILSPLQYLILFWIFAYIPNNNQERLRIIKFMLFCGAIVAAVGLLQATKIGFVNDFLSSWYASSHQAVALRENRITSLIGAWNALGIFMMFNLLIIWAFGISRPSDLGWPAILTEGGLCVACLLLSGSFAGVIGLILGIVIITTLLGIYLNSRNIILFILLTAAIAITFVLFRENILGRLDEQFGYGGPVPATLVGRFGLWRDIYLPAIQDNLFWGINPTVPDYYSWRYTESQYLDLLFSFGLVGFISYLLWNAITLKSLLRRFYQHGSFLKTVTAISFALVVVLFIAGFSNAVFSYSGSADYLWIILALVTTNEGLLPRRVQ